MPERTQTPTRTRPAVLPGTGPSPDPIRRLMPDELCPQQKTDVGTHTRRTLRP